MAKSHIPPKAAVGVFKPVVKYLAKSESKVAKKATNKVSKEAADIARKKGISPKTYARPSGFRKGVRDTAWNDAVEPRTGQVRDPLTGRFMSKEQPWDMGHRPGYESRKHHVSAAERGIHASST
jgi:toxin YqcG